MSDTTTREYWLENALMELSLRLGVDLPSNVNVSCGFPPGARGGKSPFGVCPPEMSAASEWEVFINPTIDSPPEAIGALYGAALAIVPHDDDDLSAWNDKLGENLSDLVESLGSYPHAKVLMDQRKKQPTRTFKCQCDSCNYTVRITKRWLKKATPICPVFSCSQHMMPMTIHKDGE